LTSQEIISYIAAAAKTTPLKVYLSSSAPLNFPGAKVFGTGDDLIVIGDAAEILPVLQKNAGQISQLHVENCARNSAIPLADLTKFNARIEPGAIIREGAEIGERAIVMMGAVINIGAKVGAGAMIDMNAVLGGRAEVGKNAHVGAGAVLAGVIEPPSAQPVVVGDEVLIGANAVVLEGVQIGRGAVVAAGAVVIEDVPEGAVVAGTPAKVIKNRAAVAAGKVSIAAALREL
jgi:2,3,4,5-tetrahydropyridine-2,6-dicarboxylate N-acetyltransferase